MTGVTGHYPTTIAFAAAFIACAGSASAQSTQRDMLPQTFLERQQTTTAPLDAARKRAADESKRLADELAHEKGNAAAASTTDPATAAKAASIGDPKATGETPPSPVAPPSSSSAMPPPTRQEQPPAASAVPPPVPAARPAPAQAPPAQQAKVTTPSISAEERDRLVAQGEKRLKEGDIASARLFYQRAAETGSASAARILGRLFDSGALAALGVRGVAADAEKSKYWLDYADRLERGDPPVAQAAK